MPAEGHLLSLQLESRQRAVAASAASEVSAKAWLVQPAPADANKKQNGDSVVWP